MSYEYDEEIFDARLRAYIPEGVEPLTAASHDILLAALVLLGQIGRGFKNIDDAMSFVFPNVARLNLYGYRIELLHTKIADDNIWKTAALCLSMDQSSGALQANDLWDDVFSNLEAGREHGLELLNIFELADVYKAMGAFINERDRPEYLRHTLGQSLGGSDQIRDLYRISIMDIVMRSAPLRSVVATFSRVKEAVRALLGS